MNQPHLRWTSDLILQPPADGDEADHADQLKRDLSHVPPSEIDPMIVDSLLTSHAAQMTRYRLSIGRNNLRGHGFATLRPSFDFYKDDENDEATYEQVQATFAQIYDRVEKT